ncbi:MAG: phosphate transport system protein [Actinomycetota bacterium]|jgi:phosphate transport system protein|nr:phosphate transport system protein [Actinomycetota bacterium]
MVETRKQFHEELDELNADVVHLGALAAEAIHAGTDALLNADLGAVEQVVAADRVLDELTHSIEERTYLLMARQQPMAIDLRTLVSILRVIHEIERTGDLMVNVAKATRRLYPNPLEPRVRGLLDRMREQAAVQLGAAIDAFADRDPAKAASLPDMDDVMDDLQKDLFRAIFATHSTDEATIQRAVQVALVGRYFERMADHAVNVAERVAFMVTGQFRHEEPQAG